MRRGHFCQGPKGSIELMGGVVSFLHQGAQAREALECRSHEKNPLRENEMRTVLKTFLTSTISHEKR
jgi:hypothetical protein